MLMNFLPVYGWVDVHERLSHLTQLIKLEIEQIKHYSSFQMENFEFPDFRVILYWEDMNYDKDS